MICGVTEPYFTQSLCPRSEVIFNDSQYPFTLSISFHCKFLDIVLIVEWMHILKFLINTAHFPYINLSRIKDQPRRCKDIHFSTTQLNLSQADWKVVFQAIRQKTYFGLICPSPSPVGQLWSSWLPFSSWVNGPLMFCIHFYLHPFIFLSVIGMFSVGDWYLFFTT